MNPDKRMYEGPRHHRSLDERMSASYRSPTSAPIVIGGQSTGHRDPSAPDNPWARKAQQLRGHHG